MPIQQPDAPVTPRNLGDYDAPHTSPVTPAEDFRTVLLNRVSLGAVVSGVVFALVVQIVLNMLGIGIGAIALPNANVGTVSAEAFSWAAALWWGATGIVAAFAGGLAAGRLCGDPKESTAGWHGLISWAGSVLIIAVLAVAGAGAAVSGSFSSMSGIATQSSSSAAGASLQAPGSANLTGTVPNAALPSATAETASAVGIASLISAIALIIGALAAGIGGRMGAVQPTITSTAIRQQLH